MFLKKMKKTMHLTTGLKLRNVNGFNKPSLLSQPRCLCTAQWA